MNSPMTVRELAAALMESPLQDCVVVAVLGPFLAEGGRPTGERLICPIGVASFQIADGPPVVALECVPQSKAKA